MSDYVQHTWTPGQIITPSKMNNIEGGIVSLEENIEEITSNIETIEGEITNLQNEIDEIEVEEWGTHEVTNALEDNNSFLISKISAQTNGHVRCYRTDERPIIVYDNAGNQLPPRMGSKKIKINQETDETSNAYYVYIIMDTKPNCGCYINFYDENDTLDDNFFSYHNITTGELSRKNGCLFNDIPQGYSIEVAPYDNTPNCLILIWDGQPCSYPVTASTKTIATRNNEIEITSWAEQSPIAATIQIPSNTRFLLAKPGYTFIDMYTATTTANYHAPYFADRFPCQGMRTAGFSGGGRVKNVTVVKDYDYNKQLAEQEYREMPNGDLSANIIVLDGYDIYTQESASGYAADRVQYKINCILNFDWECKKNINTDHARPNDTYPGRQFKSGIRYHGVPYRSAWGTACHPGWHVTKHTFLNAANDPDSIFYNETTALGPYYSLVCSDFATLVTGFPVPMTNWSMMHSPDVYIRKTSVVPIGECVTNGTGHVFVPTKINTTHSGNCIVTVAEQEGPITKVNNIMSGVVNSYCGIGKKTSYLLNYQFVVNSKNFVNHPAYSIVTGVLTNGSARPYVGDCGIFTSAMGIIINIKENYQYLHIQKVDTETKNAIGTGANSGILVKRNAILIENTKIDLNVSQISFVNNNKTVILRSATDNNNEFTVFNNSLENYFEDGAIYAIWADNDQSSTHDAEDISDLECFEWHDIHNNNVVKYKIENGILEIEDDSSDFWYATGHAHNYANLISSDIFEGGLTIISNDASFTNKYDISGTLLDSKDYSRYAEKAYFLNSDEMYSFFKKGKLGAYTTIKINTLKSNSEQLIPRDGIEDED